jgi:uncharacterized protein with PQ loop repeat
MGLWIELLGVSGGFITVSSILPQIWRCHHTRSTGDLSWYMFAIGYVGVSMNLVYGVAIHHPAIYINSIYSLCMNGVLTAMKWKYDNLARTNV